ncbi:MAG TPA: universal stress protein [Thermomicrobiales bacterium]|jgi:nucleotide-binding universal stress UspA family protein|nr:universal stress protein [Thermomicrobiales bacterium]
MTTQTPGQRILVPFDGSPLSAQAFPLALGLAPAGARLTVFHVEEGRDDPTGQELPAISSALDGHARDVTVDHGIGRGNIPDAIVTQARSTGADLIVMSTRGHGGLTRMAFGSVTEDVIRKSPVPVAVIHDRDEQYDSALGATSKAPDAFRRILLPLDGSDVSAGALPIASALASRLGVPVVVVSTLNLVPLSTPGMVQDAGLGMNVEQVYEESEASARQWLSTASAELDRAGVANSSEFLTGSPGIAIEGLAQSGDLIVMATHNRQGIDRLLSGSVTDQLIRSGVAPVCVVPAGAGGD